MATLFDYMKHETFSFYRESFCVHLKEEIEFLKEVKYPGGVISDSKIRRLAIKNMTLDLARVFVDFGIMTQEELERAERMDIREYN